MLRAGDIVFTSAHGGGFVSRQIQWWTRTWFESRTLASHVAIVVEPSTRLQDSIIVEQTWPRIMKSTLGKYYGTSRVYVYRDCALSDNQRMTLVEAALNARGRYGLTKVFRFLANAIIGKVISLPVVLLGLLMGRKVRGFEPPVFDWIDVTGSVVCSQFIAGLWWDLGYHFDKAWQSVTPDDLMDYCQLHPERFDRIINKSPRCLSLIQG
jgi:hypothetical protein